LEERPAAVFRTEKRRNPKTGQPYPWIVRSTAMVNHYYVYALDRNFGPFPWAAHLIVEHRIESRSSDSACLQDD
jgi:hypothetical protein